MASRDVKSRSSKSFAIIIIKLASPPFDLHWADFAGVLSLALALPLPLMLVLLALSKQAELNEILVSRRLNLTQTRSAYNNKQPTDLFESSNMLAKSLGCKVQPAKNNLRLGNFASSAESKSKLA